jgi:hypothetical protein
MLQGVVADLAVWVITFGFGSIVSWLVFLTIRHYRYAKPAYERLAGGELKQGHLESTDAKFSEIEDSHDKMDKRLTAVEHKVDRLEDKSDRNYNLLRRIAERTGVSGFFVDSDAEVDETGD